MMQGVAGTCVGGAVTMAPGLLDFLDCQSQSQGCDSQFPSNLHFRTNNIKTGPFIGKKLYKNASYNSDSVHSAHLTLLSPCTR
jgi:hypothetical protein